MMDQLALARAFRACELSVSDYVSQIERQFLTRESDVLAFLPEENRFERLNQEGQDLASRFPDPRTRPALFGLTVGVKDIFHAQRFTTQAGSRLPPYELQGTEAESVTRLKDAGALILGKTITTEFAYFTPGPTRNPHNPKHTPGGSSSGSAAAVGAGLCALALGTQTIGSIIRPAAFCGVVGFKPTYERISRAGVIPLSPSLDHVGFFAPEVGTAREIANALTSDWRLEARKGKPVLGIPEGPYLDNASDEALACFRTVCDSLIDAGYDLRRVRAMDDYAEVRARHDAIMSAEAAQVHQQWFERYESLYSRKFTDLIKRGQSISNLQSHLDARNTFRTQITQIMDENKVDLWICPSATGPAPKGLDSTGDPVMNLPWTQTGFPVINLPSGKSDDGLPMGLQIAGKWGMDEELLAWAEGIEKVVSQI